MTSPQTFTAGSRRRSTSHRSRRTAIQPLKLIAPALEAFARATLLIVICAAPWWYGGVELDVQVWLDAGLLVSLACWTAASFLFGTLGRMASVPLPTLTIPLLGALVLGSIQLVPGSTPAFTRGQLAASAVPSVTEVANSSVTPSVRSLLPKRSAAGSIYPAATRLEVARLGMAFIACFLGMMLFQTSWSRAWLWGALAINGACIAFFGIVQQLSWNGKLFWTIPLLLGGQPFGPFVNRNNAAGYLILCLAAACGLIIFLLNQPQTAQQRGHGSRFPWQSGRRVPSSLFDGPVVTAILLAACIAAGIFCSVSRGGVLATIAASTVILFPVARSRGIVVTSSLFLTVLGLGIGLVYWTGLEGRFFGRWSASSGDTVATGAETRLSNWKDALNTVEEFPVLGTGFGTYSFAYLPHQSWPAPVRFYNADNQYVEALVEGGVVGLSLVLISIGACLAAGVVLMSTKSTESVGIVAVFALIGQSVSALFDFGPTMSANMLTLAVIAGTITSQIAAAEIASSRKWVTRWLILAEPLPPTLLMVVNFSLLAYGVLAIREVSLASDCRNAWRDLPKRLDSPDAIPDLDLETSIQQLILALSNRPDDADANVALANLWIYRYRRQTYDSMNELKSRGGPALNWAMTDPLMLFDRVNRWIETNDRATLKHVRESAVVRDNLTHAHQHLVMAQAACPLMPGLDARLGTLSTILETDHSKIGAALKRAIEVYRCDPDILEMCGTLAQSAGLSSFAMHCWSQCIALQPARIPRIRAQLSKQQLDELLFQMPTTSIENTEN